MKKLKVYGSGQSELLIGEALRDYERDKVFISVKFGALMAPNGSMYGLDVRPLTIKNYQDAIQSLDISLSENDIKRIEEAIPENEIAGGSFPEMKFKNGIVVH